MPKLKKPIQDTELKDRRLFRNESILFTPETYTLLLTIAKEREKLLDIAPVKQRLTHKKIHELARHWLKSGAAPVSLVENLHKLALHRSIPIVQEACIKAFLEAHPNIKLADNIVGRPSGNTTPESRLRIAMGLVIADLLNASPSLVSKILKAA